VLQGLWSVVRIVECCKDCGVLQGLCRPGDLKVVQK